jgi:hypothetical protein
MSTRAVRGVGFEMDANTHKWVSAEERDMWISDSLRKICAGGLRRITVLATVLLLTVIGLPGVATADRPSTSARAGADLFCEMDTGFLGISVFEYPEFEGAFLDVFFESFEEPFGVFGFTEEFSFDGTTLVAEVAMFLEEHDQGENGEENGEENGNGEPEPVGIASIGATWSPAGEPEVFAERFREGNTWIEFRETFTPADTSGSAVLEGFFDLDLGECGGSLFETAVWQTNPSAFNNRFSDHVVECQLEGPDGEGFLFAVSGDFGQFMDIIIGPFEARTAYGFTEEFVLTDTELSGVVELMDEETWEPVGEAIVDFVLESTNVASSDVVLQNGRVKIVEEFFDVSGTFAVDGAEFALVDCSSVAADVREHFADPSGPKPSGKTPVNDAPEGALSLEARGTTNAQTNGAANAPEVACSFVFDENGEEPEEFPLPIGKTLWYTFEGTGEEVTIDSAGSNFDTILGIYDGELNQLDCVDDVGDESGFSLQAAVTIETNAGETYLIQIGGFGFFEDEGEEFPGEFGRIRINMS